MTFKEQWPARAFTIRDGAGHYRCIVVKGRDRWRVIGNHVIDARRP